MGNYGLSYPGHGLVGADCENCVSQSPRAMFGVSAVIIFSLAVVLFLYRLLVVTNNSCSKFKPTGNNNKKKNFQVLFKVLFTAFQFHFLAVGQNFSFPPYVKTMLWIYRVGGIGFHNFDCLVKGIFPDTASQFIWACVLYISPVVIIFVLSICLMLFAAIDKYQKKVVNWHGYFREMTSITIGFVFFFYSNMLTTFFSMFNCTALGESSYLLRY